MNLILIYIFLGILARTVLPYLVAKLQEDGPLAFDFRYLIGQALGNVVAYLPAVFDPVYLDSLYGIAPLVAVGIGWGFSDMGREAYKFVSAVYQNYRGG